MPQTEGKSKQIDGVTYTVHMLPPRKARDIAWDLGSALGPSFGRFIDAGQGGSDSDVFASGLRDLFDRMSKEKLDLLMNEMASVTEADGVKLKPIFDVHFLGSVGRMFSWFRFALEVNFEDFFSTLKSAIEPYLAAQDPGSSSPNT